MPRIISIQQPKANKQHRCNYCLGIIEKGETYEKTFLIQDDCYTWKSHLKCQEIASKLKMFDNEDYGVTDEIFIENIKFEYITIMEEYHSEIFESEDFIYPSFIERLNFVIAHHKV